MNMPIRDDRWALTDKEKQTLRLVVRGHDAKSIARSLGLSVHTINERLRDARRKMAVSSSREAARLLFEAEDGDAVSPAPKSLADMQIGADPTPFRADPGAAPVDGVVRSTRRAWIIIGVSVMTLAAGLLMLAALPQAASPPTSTPAASIAPRNADVVNAASQWLSLLDQARWEESYQATGAAFHKHNTALVWADVSEKVRKPLGDTISRTVISEQFLPAPPSGYEVVTFRTHFTNKAEAVETVSLDREGGTWRIVGVTIE